MMITLSANDIRKLSPACRAELMALVMPSDNDELTGDDRVPAGTLDGIGTADEAAPNAEDVLEEKRVVDLSVDEARDLLANISDRSKDTLKRFASGKPVALSSLIGTGGAYRDYSELKRSFVGAVNRRLRTVSGNRNAAFFSSDRDKTRIKTTPKTAMALRCVFNLPEPLPEFEFINREGKSVDADMKLCQELNTRLTSAWGTFTGRPSDTSTDPWPTQVLNHFLKAGLELFIGTPVGWDEATESETYEVHTVSDPSTVIRNAVEDGFPEKLTEVFFGPGSDAQVLARPVI